MLSSGCGMAYADDLILICADDTPVDAALSAENTINFVFKWATNQGLIRNAQKCDKALFISLFTRKLFHSKYVYTSKLYCSITFFGVIVIESLYYIRDTAI